MSIRQNNKQQLSTKTARRSEKAECSDFSLLYLQRNLQEMKNISLSYRPSLTLRDLSQRSLEQNRVFLVHFLYFRSFFLSFFFVFVFLPSAVLVRSIPTTARKHSDELRTRILLVKTVSFNFLKRI